VLVGIFFIFSFHFAAGYGLFSGIETEKVLSLLMLNASVLTIQWLLYILVKEKYGQIVSLAALVIFWLSIEHATSNFNIGCPWFNLGHSLGSYPGIIQWYEFTGSAGGSLWILASNVLVMLTISSFNAQQESHFRISLTVLACTVVIPILLSYSIRTDLIGQEEEVLVLDINHTKSMLMDPTFDELLASSARYHHGGVRYVVWPESVFGMVEARGIEDDSRVKDIRGSIVSDCSVLVCGATVREGNNYYNSGLVITERSHHAYSKKILVPFAEATPTYFFKWLQIFEKPYETTSFSGTNHELGAMSIDICYEELFGQRVSENCRESNCRLIAIISNERWTQGAAEGTIRLGVIRAIESRKDVVRSTIDGYSSIIRADGVVTRLESDSDRPINVLVGKVTPNSIITTYMRYGDYIGSIAIAVSIVGAIFVMARGLLAG
jgi:apolipoprotein N-acyltransferase